MTQATQNIVNVDVGEVALEGELTLPENARGIVVFAHGSGSSRHSPRNKAVAAQLREGPIGTLLIDLLTEEEEQVDLRTRELRFDIDMLAERVVGATDWLAQQEQTSALKVGLFGSSTGAAAALKAAAARPDRVGAVVSRGGRADLAGNALPDVEAPTLLIVGGKDEPVIGMNKEAQQRLNAENELDIVEGASHLFEEPGKLDEVAALARDWFVRYIGS
ncbi:MAG: alpha/beta family hydrolase [Trueperaceae bacterium]|nr:alpha/beta family hydrolase [Trueperaceae bacterium]